MDDATQGGRIGQPIRSYEEVVAKLAEQGINMTVDQVRSHERLALRKLRAAAQADRELRQHLLDLGLLKE